MRRRSFLLCAKEKIKTQPEGAKEKKPSEAPKTGIKEMLDGASREELVEFLFQLAGESKEVKTRIELKFSSGNGRTKALQETDSHLYQ